MQKHGKKNTTEKHKAARRQQKQKHAPENVSQKPNLRRREFSRAFSGTESRTNMQKHRQNTTEQHEAPLAGTNRDCLVPFLAGTGGVCPWDDCSARGLRKMFICVLCLLVFFAPDFVEIPDCEWVNLKCCFFASPFGCQYKFLRFDSVKDFK